uniref:Uncharacterized protein n=1 Tax=Anopheles coluzzii TaxID=1518534 RepID=A0A8W7P2U1_ANOCL
MRMFLLVLGVRVQRDQSNERHRYHEGAVAAEERDVPPALHADAAAVRFLYLHDLALEVAQPVGGQQPAVLRALERAAGGGRAPLDVQPAGETLLHPHATLGAGDLVLAGLEHDQRERLVAHDALARRVRRGQRRLVEQLVQLMGRRRRGGGTGGGVGLAEDAAPAALAGAAGVGGWGTLLSCTNCRGLLCFAAAALVVVPNMPDRWLAPPRHGFIIGFANIPSVEVCGGGWGAAPCSDSSPWLPAPRTAGGVTSAPAVVASRAAAAAAAAACPRLRRAGVGGLLLLLLLLPPAGPLEEEDDGGGGGEAC